MHRLMLKCRRDADMFTRGGIVSSLPKCVHVDWNWPIPRAKYLKIDWSAKMPLQWFIMGVAGPLYWAPVGTHCRDVLKEAGKGF